MSGAELAGGDFHVVDAKSGDHVRHGQAVIGELVGVEPDAHGVLAAKGHHFANTRDTREVLFEVGLGIVHEVVHVHAAVFRDEADDQQVVPGGLADLNAGLLDHGGEAGQGELELILHLGPGEVRVGAGGEGQFDARRAGRVAAGGKVEQVVEAGHLLLDDLRHAVFDGLRRGPRIERGNSDGRRSDGRILRYGEIVDGEEAQHHDDDRDNPGEDRTIQEKSR